MKKTIRLDLPPQLKMLCDLLGTTPEKVLQGFIYDVSLTPLSHGSDERAMACGYFIRCGYGNHLFAPAQVDQMMEGLNMIRYINVDISIRQTATRKSFTQRRLNEWHRKWKTEKQKKTN